MVALYKRWTHCGHAENEYGNSLGNKKIVPVKLTLKFPLLPCPSQDEEKQSPADAKPLNTFGTLDVANLKSCVSIVMLWAKRRI